jgi:hypothetical protein
MTSKLDERSERVSRLQSLVERDAVELPPFDPPALDTLLSQLHEEKQRQSRWRKLGWTLVVAVALLAAVLLLVKLL